jgi:hypothetical protein
MNGDYLGFDTVPTGDWNVANLVLSTNGKFLVDSTENKRFPDATAIWNASKIDLLELGECLEQCEANELQLLGHVPSNAYPSPEGFGIPKVLAFWNFNLEGQHNHGLSQESYIYSLFQDISIAPRFLAHLTDNHERVIGYVLESVPARQASISDLDLCQDVLRKLHDMGIAHGNISKECFLIRTDIPIAQLQFFYESYETSDRAIFDKEISSLEEVLQQRVEREDNRGTSEELTTIQDRDGYIHPALFWQLKHEGKVIVSQEDHRAMLADLEKKSWVCTAEDVQSAIERLQKNGGHWN